jgi:hypothetical protein
VLHAFAAVLGPLVATLVVGAFVATLVWRTAAIAVALTLVVRDRKSTRLNSSH